jgi:potassium-transporting ATPase potassium-binding subunit
MVILLVKPLGGYMMRVFTGQKTLLDPVCLPVERAIYRLAGIDPNRQMSAKHYSIAFVFFSLERFSSEGTV